MRKFAYIQKIVLGEIRLYCLKGQLGRSGRYEASGAWHVVSLTSRKAWNGMCYDYFIDKIDSLYLVPCIFSMESEMEFQ